MKKYSSRKKHNIPKVQNKPTKTKKSSYFNKRKRKKIKAKKESKAHKPISYYNSYGFNFNSRGNTVSLRTKIRFYEKKAKEIEHYLQKRPHEWGKFQNEFNSELNSIFRDIMYFEKNNLTHNRQDKTEKLKQLFIKRFRNLFAKGEYVRWSLRKPFGYAGDFKIIDDFYRNDPTTTGFRRLFDNYAQMSALAVAIRNRKDDFKKFITNHVKKKTKKCFRIMDIASGPCRDLKELFAQDDFPVESITIDCYENDKNAIDYAKKLLKNPNNINFFNMNVVKTLLRKNAGSKINKKYDFIYSTGLFEYLSNKVVTRIMKNLKKLLSDNGHLFIANVRDKFSNPTVYFMEWAGEWNLIYRNEEEFRNLFINAGFKPKNLKKSYEQQGIIQYMRANGDK